MGRRRPGGGSVGTVRRDENRRGRVFDARQERRTEGGQPLAPQRLALFVRQQLARSLRAIAVELAKLGHLAPGGKPYEATRVKRMLER